MEYLTAIFSSILPQLPSLFLHAVGLGFSISRRNEYPRTALAAGIYFGLSLLIGLATQVYVVLPMYMVEQGGSTQDRKMKKRKKSLPQKITWLKPNTR